MYWIVTACSLGGEYQRFDRESYLQFHIYLFEAAERCVIHSRLEDHDLSQPSRLHYELRKVPQQMMPIDHHICVAQGNLSVMVQTKPNVCAHGTVLMSHVLLPFTVKYRICSRNFRPRVFCAP